MKKTFNFGKIAYGTNKNATNEVIVIVEYKENRKGQKVFSACGTVYTPSKQGTMTNGQCLDDIAQYVTDDTFKTIYRLWRLYHLNDMHAECGHQHALKWHEKAKKQVNLYNWRMKHEIYRKQKENEKAALEALKKGKTFKLTPEQQYLANLDYSLVTHTETLPENIAEFYEEKKPLFRGDDRHVEVKTLGWLKENEHPEGILGKACPVCGYKYGSSWIYFPIPEEDEKILLELLGNEA